MATGGAYRVSDVVGGGGLLYEFGWGVDGVDAAVQVFGEWKHSVSARPCSVSLT
jgi:hypothetical protein